MKRPSMSGRIVGSRLKYQTPAEAMVRRVVSAWWLVALFLGSGVGSVPMVIADVDEDRGNYVIGRAFSGSAGRTCIADEMEPVLGPQSFDVGGVCDLRCPGGTCDITVIDEVSTIVNFRVCFDGEFVCRPQIYSNTASVPGDRVNVVVSTEDGTRGVVIVR